MTYSLDEISYKRCQQWKSSRQAAHNSLAGKNFMQAMSAMEIMQTSYIQLTLWMRFHVCSFSNGNQADKLYIAYKLDS